MNDKGNPPVYNDPSTTHPPAGTSTGDKVRGVAQVIHGVGENVRGSFLGAVDALFTGHASPENEEITRQARLEIERGKANVRGVSNTAPPPTAPQTTYGMNYPPVSEYNTTTGPNPQPQEIGTGHQPVQNYQAGATQPLPGDGYYNSGPGFPGREQSQAQGPTKYSS